MSYRHVPVDLSRFLKIITGRDRIVGRNMNSARVTEFIPECKVAITSNYMLPLKVDDRSMTSRIVYVESTQNSMVSNLRRDQPQAPPDTAGADGVHPA